MTYYAGLDVSVKSTAVCIVDESGKVVKERALALLEHFPINGANFETAIQLTGILFSHR